MQLLAPLFYASTVLAFSLDLRDPKLISRQASQDIAADIKAITSATDGLTAALRNFNDASTALAVNAATGKVSDAIKKGTSDANALSSISQADALTLSGPIGDLNDATKRSIDQLIAKKPLFVSLGFAGIVLDTLKSQQAQSSAFSEAVISKIPEGLRTIASNISKPAADAIAAGIAAFSNTSSGMSTSTAAAMGGAKPTTTSPMAAPAPTTTMAYGGGASPTTPVGSMVSNIGSMGSQIPGSTPITAAYTPTGCAVTQIGDGQLQCTSTPEAYTGAAMPTAAAGFGAFAAAAMAVAAAAL
ncbi:uncharacterized protein MYCFIDRAFT_85652 [Pseudocercospora fijiensis CIRAD86]|uniref:Cell wall mannoprotein 1 n=1 Tax=Pseudocercospora fijiensis (strain CIRAD86) TaxID=383855 RepID=N1Q5U3_PSEFD|nr:uncharacterized protein MYCFIDRAFT_85652 [Pseudocercospora fijiensis CIRAD86]EME87359.1 hypothetical protein MYCFIDRAFT_85652 [Pseudocercospora fijiensis CIRAD86]